MPGYIKKLKFKKTCFFCISQNINFFWYLPISKISVRFTSRFSIRIRVRDRLWFNIRLRVRVRFEFSTRVRISVQILKYLSPPTHTNTH